MRAAEADPLPTSWDAAAPSTWRFVSGVAVVVPSVLIDPDDAIVGRRELVTGAHEFADAGDPALLLRMLPRRAAAWWAGVLGQIHRARVAVVGHRRATEQLLAGEPPLGGGPRRVARGRKPPAAEDAGRIVGRGGRVPRRAGHRRRPHHGAGCLNI